MTDRGAIESIAETVCYGCHFPEKHARPQAQRIIDALAADGYVVVKKNAVVVRVVGMNPTPLGVASEAIFGPFPDTATAIDWLDRYRTRVEVHLAPQVMPLWEPVPDGSEE